MEMKRPLFKFGTSSKNRLPKARRKIEIQNKIETMKFDTKTDINIFIANLQNLIDELEKIDNDLSINTKIGILNRCLPEDLRWINVFQHKSWESCCSYVKEIIPNIVLSNLKEKIQFRKTTIMFSSMLKQERARIIETIIELKVKEKASKGIVEDVTIVEEEDITSMNVNSEKIIYIKIKTKINLIKELKTKENFKTILIM